MLVSMSMDSRQLRRWRLYRWLYRFGLVLWFASIACYFVPNLIMFGRPLGITPSECVPEVEAVCVPEVVAIRQFERDHGALPAEPYLRELAPTYLREAPVSSYINGKRYIHISKQHQLITYVLDGVDEHFDVAGVFGKRRIPVRAVVLPPATRPASSSKP